jgi:small-conductance mechanosensitive channel
MNDSSRNALLLRLLTRLQDTNVLWEVAAAAGCLAAAWLLSRVLKPRIAALNTSSGFSREALAMLRFPLIALVLTLIAAAVLGGNKNTVLELLMALLVAAILIRLVVVMLRQVFAPSGWRDRLIRIFAWVVWLGFALHVAGLTGEVLKYLDAIGFSVGKSRISLLLILQGVLSVMATLLVALWVGRFIEARAMAAEDLNINLRVMISKLSQAILVLVAILLALPAVGIDLTVLSVFGGALGVGLGFGLQKIASSYVSGFIILMDRSVSLGDLVTVDNHTGRLTKMTARYVVIRSLGGQEAIVPNDTLITSTVLNQSYTDTRTRQSVGVQVSYDSDLESAMALLVEIAKRHSRTLDDPTPKAFVVKFADSGIDLELGFWVSDAEKGIKGLQSDLHLEIWREFRRHNIEIPFPQRVVRLARDTDVTAGLDESSSKQNKL